MWRELIISREFYQISDKKFEFRTYEMAARLYEKMDTEILANSSCIAETTWYEKRNYTQVFNLNEVLLNGTEEYVDFFYFTVRAYSKKTSSRKNVG